MKSIFEQAIRDELITRVHFLNETSIAQWGKMSVYQMMKHCTMWEEMMLGKKKYKRSFIGRLVGSIALRNVLKDESPLKRSTPTIPALRISEKGSVSSQKREWIARIEEYGHFSNPDFVHVFFGKMTKEQIGYLVYKHIDHHLRQFNS